VLLVRFAGFDFLRVLYGAILLCYVQHPYDIPSPELSHIHSR
jgi:hypothetical protein